MGELVTAAASKSARFTMRRAGAQFRGGSFVTRVMPVGFHGVRGSRRQAEGATTAGRRNRRRPTALLRTFSIS